MRRTLKATGRQHERGAVAIEAAIVLPILLLLLGLPSIFLAFYFRQYSAAQKAVHDAALYLSTAPRVEMTTAGPDGAPAALTLARKIIAMEMAGLVPDDVPMDPGFVCIYKQPSGNLALKPCTMASNQASNQTLVQFAVSLEVSYINPLTGSDTGMMISPYAPIRYVGN
jgi:Flp pilus assembly protein TadG